MLLVVTIGGVLVGSTYLYQSRSRRVIVDPIVVSGKALVGQSGADFMSNAIAKGAPLRCIGANYQKNNRCIMSMSEQVVTSAGWREPTSR